MLSFSCFILRLQETPNKILGTILGSGRSPSIAQFSWSCESPRKLRSKTALHLGFQPLRYSALQQLPVPVKAPCQIMVARKQKHLPCSTCKPAILNNKVVGEFWRILEIALLLLLESISRLWRRWFSRPKRPILSIRTQTSSTLGPSRSAPQENMHIGWINMSTFIALAMGSKKKDGCSFCSFVLLLRLFGMSHTLLMATVQLHKVACLAMVSVQPWEVCTTAVPIWCRLADSPSIGQQKETWRNWDKRGDRIGYKAIPSQQNRQDTSKQWQSWFECQKVVAKSHAAFYKSVDALNCQWHQKIKDFTVRTIEEW